MTRKNTKPFENSLEHLLAELRCLDLLIHSEVLRSRRAFQKDQQVLFKGMCIPDAEIDLLLEAEPGNQPLNDDGEAEALHRAMSALSSQIAHRKRLTLDRGLYLTLPHLAHMFGLSRFEEQVILICLASEIDAKYEKLYAYLHDNITRGKPSAGLTLRLLYPTPEGKLQARASFSHRSPLFTSQILHYLDGDEHSLPSRTLKLDEGIVNYLLGTGSLSKEILDCCRLVTVPEDLQRLRWPESFKSRLVEVTRSYIQTTLRSPRKLIYHLHGPEGTGKKSLAAGLCREIGAPLLVVDMREILVRAQSVEVTLRSIFREAILQPTAIYLQHFDLLLGDDNRDISYRHNIARLVDEYSWLTFLATEKPWEPGGIFKDHIFISIDLPMPDMAARAELWMALAKNGASSSRADWDQLASKFRLTPGRMQDALIAARNYARLRASEDATITLSDLYQGCRLQSNQKLATLSRKLAASNDWSDITLPDNALAQLREICAQVKHRQTIYGKWGFGRKQSLGKGLCALFHGPSGTGKTLAVEIIANDLNLDAFKIDLSTIVSKYIGETEKNLNKVFSEAETSNAILFFDEADALFGKRSEVKDSHDRYANIEINYLLQRMEEYDGIVILATNFRRNIDEAFFRRMHFAVEFPPPDQGHRYRIWKQQFPESAPVSDDIDFNFLANRFSIGGGSIKNIVVNAAFLAAENSGVIGMKHLIRATRREYEKIGRLCADTEFAPYHSLLNDH